MRPASEDQISEDRGRLQNPYAHVNGDGEFEALAPDSCAAAQAVTTATQSAGPAQFTIDRDTLLRQKRPDGSYSDAEIEAAVRALHVELWRNRDKIYPQADVQNPLDILDPAFAIRCLGLSYDVQESLGQFADTGGRFEVAGIVDRPSSRVSISRQFPPEVQNFTAAHELGHCVLHGATMLHRDRPLDGSGSANSRDRREVEANKFAAAFLLPEKQVRLRFEQSFGTDKLILDDDTAFFLASQGQDKFRASLSHMRDFSRFVAQTAFYAGQPITPLTKQFNVSVETMAIQLEDLNLIALD